MALTTYTTYEEIRAILGVTTEDIEDATLALPMYETVLELKLEDIDSDLISMYETVAAITENSRTAAQARFYRIVRLYSGYVVANELLTSSPIFAPKRIADGKAEMERFDEWEQIRSGVASGLADMFNRLKAAYAVLEPGYQAPAGVTLRFVGSTGLANDPVTSST